MGRFDFLCRPDDGRDRVAIEIDLAAGVLERCPVCRDITNRQRDDLPRRLRCVRDRFPFNCTCQDSG